MPVEQDYGDLDEYVLADPDADWMEARNERLVMIRSAVDSAAPSHPLTMRAYEGDDENYHHRRQPAIDSIISSREVICAQAAGLGDLSVDETSIQNKIVSNQPSMEHSLEEDQVVGHGLDSVRVREPKRVQLTQGQSTIETAIDLNNSNENAPSKALPPVRFGMGGASAQPAAGLGAAVNEDEVPESGKVCRICLEEEATDDNGGLPEDPFITPCKCTGSMKFIHVGCIRGWLDGRK